MIPARLLPMLVDDFLGMGGAGVPDVVSEAGPLCACAVQYYLPSGIGQAYTPGASAVDTYSTTSVGQGDCC